MKLALQAITTPEQALALLEQKGVLPTGMSGAEARAALAKELRRAAMWSARTTHAVYLQALKNAVARVLRGGSGNDLATVRMELRQLLAVLEYDPATGFPGDTDIPPAERGDLRDLGSRKRIDLAIKTQVGLAQGAALKARGNDGYRARNYPAWELRRVGVRRVPRGSTKEAGIGWQRRWLLAGGPILASGRLVALKTDPVWAKLGDSGLFDDALDVDHPPFAFNSGMGWGEVDKEEAEELGLPVRARTQTGVKQGDASMETREESGKVLPRPQEGRAGVPPASSSPVLPRPQASTGGLDVEMARRLRAELDAKGFTTQAARGKLRAMVAADIAESERSYQAR